MPRGKAMPLRGSKPRKRGEGSRYADFTPTVSKGDGGQMGRQSGAYESPYSGTCPCGMLYRVGDLVFVNPETDEINGARCCGATHPVYNDEYDMDLDNIGRAFDDEYGRDMVPPSQVMPIGRSKADMCLRCFQIPSSSGVCGC